jgi:hypothetical protein
MTQPETEVKTLTMKRRLKSTTLLLVNQMLFIALAVIWLLQMIIIAKEGSAYFIENNKLILFGEITVVVLIMIFAIYILINQINKLGERRAGDRRSDSREQYPLIPDLRSLTRNASSSPLSPPQLGERTLNPVDVKSVAAAPAPAVTDKPSPASRPRRTVP